MKFSRLIGEPYENMNCWDIAREFYKLEFGIELLHHFDNPNDAEITKSLIYSNIGHFEKVDNPKFGDIVLIKVRGVESHIGVVISSTQFLHTNKRTGCILDRLDTWSKVVSGFYRLKERSCD